MELTIGFGRIEPHGHARPAEIDQKLVTPGANPPHILRGRLYKSGGRQEVQPWRQLAIDRPNFEVDSQGTEIRSRIESVNDVGVGAAGRPDIPFEYHVLTVVHPSRFEQVGLTLGAALAPQTKKLLHRLLLLLNHSRALSDRGTGIPLEIVHDLIATRDSRDFASP